MIAIPTRKEQMSVHHHVVAPVSPLTPSSPPMRWSSSTIKRLTFWTFFLCFQRLDRTSHFSPVPIITSPYNNKNPQPPLHYAIYSDIHSSPQTPPWSKAQHRQMIHSLPDHKIMITRI